MRRLTAVFLGLIAAVALSAAGLALAGGWAVVKLDALPSDISSGKPVSIGFTVLQHGVSPLAGLDPVVRTTHASSGERVEVIASGEGAPGHYAAVVAFPSSGTWNWSISAFGAEHVMPPVEVLAADTGQAKPAVTGSEGIVAVESAGVGDAIESAPVANGASLQRRVALGLGAAGLALLLSASALGAWWMRRAPLPVRG